MPTNKPKSVTIELTPKQQEKLRKLTGQDHSEIRVEFAKGRATRKPLSAKAAPSAKLGQKDTVVGGGLPVG